MTKPIARDPIYRQRVFNAGWVQIVHECGHHHCRN
jgi:hypothetical protein